MKIGLDLDDVISDFFPSFISFYNQRYGKNARFEDMTDYSIWKVGIGRDREEVIAFFNEFFESLESDEMPLVLGAKSGVEELACSNTGLSIVTSRPVRFMRKTQAFLKKYFPEIPFSIHYSSGLHNSDKTKAQICKREGIEVFVEDCLKYAEECAQNGVRVLLFDKPWNQGSNGKIERVHNWQEIIERINDYEVECGQ
jgi:uncharacterized HAD superfamily protein